MVFFFLSLALGVGHAPARTTSCVVDHPVVENGGARYGMGC